MENPPTLGEMVLLLVVLAVLVLALSAGVGFAVWWLSGGSL